MLSAALELLPHEPPGHARDTRELDILTALGVALVIREGYGTPEVIDTYIEGVGAAASASANRPTDPWCSVGSASPPGPRRAAAGLRARRHGCSTLGASADDDDEMVRVEGNYVLGVTSFWQGEFAAARDHLRQAIAEYLPDRARSHSRCTPRTRGSSA